LSGSAGPRPELLLGILVALSLLCWIVLTYWYSLPAHHDRTHFAFEKIPGGFGSPVIRGTLLLFLTLATIYVLGYLVLIRQTTLSRWARLAVVLLVVGPGIITLFIYPVGALDAFNYMIELKLAYGYGANPYLVTFADYRSDPFALPAFLVDVPLFYGPVWLLAHGLPVAVVGFGSIVTLLGALKIFNLVLLLLTGLLIFRAQGQGQRGWIGAYLFLANPLVLFEGIGNAHNDILMTLLLVAALVALSDRSVTAPAWLALAALVKFFAVALAPIVLVAARRHGWGWRRLVFAGLLAALVVAGTVAPFWAGGEMIGGLRQGTEKSQRMNHVSILSLTQQAVRTRPISTWVAPLFTLGSGCVPRARATASSPDTPTPCRQRWVPPSTRKEMVTRAGAVVFVVLALAVAASVARGRPPEAAAVDTLMLFFLLLTNLYPWYLIPIVALLALRRDRLGLRYLFTATALGLAYYPVYVYARHGSGWDELTLHLVLALFLTVPMLGFLAAELWRFIRRWYGARGQARASAWELGGLARWRPASPSVTEL
jgi:hypothetical protein